METLEEKISAHNAETPDSVLELKEEVDALYNNLEVRHTDQQNCKQTNIIIQT